MFTRPIRLIVMAHLKAIVASVFYIGSITLFYRLRLAKINKVEFVSIYHITFLWAYNLMNYVVCILHFVYCPSVCT